MYKRVGEVVGDFGKKRKGNINRRGNLKVIKVKGTKSSSYQGGNGRLRTKSMDKKSFDTERRKRETETISLSLSDER